MKFRTRLDSAVFQLTPTRTRCDLVIFANGKSEKIASGLVTPFLAHLKTARDQMAKGGYSIILELEPGSDATWFTKRTVERFVRFVSTPEVLERVYSLESEILQIEEAIGIQSNNDMGLSAVDHYHQPKPLECIEGSNCLTGSNEEKAIVLYKPSSPVPEANGSSLNDGDSKVQLMKVLETRKTVLQKEQGMAFARAVAAGFDIDHLAPLMSFAESFGASRLMDACVRFMELWKRKHKTGQWVDFGAAEAMSTQSHFAGTNGSGIVLSNAVNKQGAETPDSNRKSEEKPSGDQQLQPDYEEHFQGQFPHPVFPPWPMHSPPGAGPVFPGYPMQGIPYYQNYPGNNPFFQSLYPPGEDPRLNPGQRMRQRHSMDSNTDPETGEVDINTRYQGDVELEKETPGTRELGRRGSHSVKQKSGVVVIRNINYITRKRQDSSDNDPESASETDEENEDKSASARDSKRKGSHKKFIDKLNSSDREGKTYGKEEDGGHWQAFQTYLQKDADETECAANQGMFGMEKEAQLKRRQKHMGVDPLAFDGRNLGDNQEENNTDVQSISGNFSRMARSSDESLMSKKMGQSTDVRRFVDTQSEEVDGRRAGYRRCINDDFVINTRGYALEDLDTLALNKFEHLDKRSSQNMDDSYIVSLRSNSSDHVGTRGRSPIDMDSEFPTVSQRVENQVKYEPDDFSLMSERGTERESTTYDPALDYDGKFHTENNVSLNKRNKEMICKKSDKDHKSKLTPDTLDRKKTIGPIRRGRPSKLNPMDEARARAEKLRTFKADLQKMKKEKEEEDRKRLEALKMARQKRIASNSLSALPALQPTRKQLPAKRSPRSQKGSKFADTEPGNSSPLQRSPVKPVSIGSNSDSQKASKSNKLSTGGLSAGNRVSRSVSSLPAKKKESYGFTPDEKPSKDRIRRLSEPKIVSSHKVASVKPRVSIKPEKKKYPPSCIMTKVKLHCFRN